MKKTVMFISLILTFCILLISGCENKQTEAEIERVAQNKKQLQVAKPGDFIETESGILYSFRKTIVNDTISNSCQLRQINIWATITKSYDAFSPEIIKITSIDDTIVWYALTRKLFTE